MEISVKKIKPASGNNVSRGKECQKRKEKGDIRSVAIGTGNKRQTHLSIEDCDVGEFEVEKLIDRVECACNVKVILELDHNVLANKALEKRIEQHGRCTAGIEAAIRRNGAPDRSLRSCPVAPPFSTNQSGKVCKSQFWNNL